MAAVDKFVSWTKKDQVIYPAGDAAMAVPSDDDDLPLLTRAIVCLKKGNVRVTTEAGTDLTIPFSQDGIGIPLRISKVWDTGTTSTSILLLY